MKKSGFTSFGFWAATLALFLVSLVVFGFLFAILGLAASGNVHDDSWVPFALFGGLASACGLAYLVHARLRRRISN